MASLEQIAKEIKNYLGSLKEYNAMLDQHITLQLEHKKLQKKYIASLNILREINRCYKPILDECKGNNLKIMELEKN